MLRQARGGAKGPKKSRFSSSGLLHSHIWAGQLGSKMTLLKVTLLICSNSSCNSGNCSVLVIQRGWSFSFLPTAELRFYSAVCGVCCAALSLRYYSGENIIFRAWEVLCSMKKKIDKFHTVYLWLPPDIIRSSFFFNTSWGSFQLDLYAVKQD